MHDPINASASSVFFHRLPSLPPPSSIVFHLCHLLLPSSSIICVLQRDRGKAVALFREPSQRVISAYHAHLHTVGMKSELRATMKAAVAAALASGPNGTDAALRAFATARSVAGCQTRMVLGHKCAADVDPSPADVAAAQELLAGGAFAFVGLVERWGAAAIHSAVHLAVTRSG